MRGSGFSIDWKRRDGAFGDGIGAVKSAVIDDRIVIVATSDPYGCEDCAPGIWWEDGDLVWRTADHPPLDQWVQLADIAVGGPGLVVVGEQDCCGALVWVSVDGRSWQSVKTSNLPWSITEVVAAADGLIISGHTDSEFGGVFTSHDGKVWTRTSDPTTERVVRYADAIAGPGEQLTAFVYEDDRVRLYRASHVDSWQPIAELPTSRGASITNAVVGPRGWVALGNARGGIAWTSPDGINWQLAESAPTIGEINAVFGIAAGFVAVGTYNPGAVGCVVVDDWHTVTWTSSDGHIWRLGEDIDENSRIESLRRRAGTLIGLGVTGYSRDGTVWTARLPDPAADNGPAPTPTFLDLPPGC